MNITQPVCVFVALGTRHEMRIRHIVICVLPLSTIFFPYYLIKARFNLYPTNAPDPFKSASYERTKLVRCGHLNPLHSHVQA